MRRWRGRFLDCRRHKAKTSGIAAHPKMTRITRIVRNASAKGAASSKRRDIVARHERIKASIVHRVVQDANRRPCNPKGGGTWGNGRGVSRPSPPTGAAGGEQDDSTGSGNGRGAPARAAGPVFPRSTGGGGAGSSAHHHHPSGRRRFRTA